MTAKEKGATIMVIGAIMLVFIHAMFSIPFLDNWLIALFLVVLLGIAFSLVPSAMWLSVPKIIPENKLNCLCTDLLGSELGTMGVPYLIGKVLNALIARLASLRKVSRSSTTRCL